MAVEAVGPQAVGAQAVTAEASSAWPEPAGGRPGQPEADKAAGSAVAGSNVCSQNTCSTNVRSIERTFDSQLRTNERPGPKARPLAAVRSVEFVRPVLVQVALQLHPRDIGLVVLVADHAESFQHVHQHVEPFAERFEEVLIARANECMDGDVLKTSGERHERCSVHL